MTSFGWAGLALMILSAYGLGVVTGPCWRLAIAEARRALAWTRVPTPDVWRQNGGM